MFKKFIAVALLALGFSAVAQAQVSISVDSGPVGRYEYGTIVAGDDRPDLVYDAPRIVTRTSYVSDPVYLYVPDYAYSDWPRYCGYYGYCNRPVFFVQENWYRYHYPRYRPGYDRPGFRNDFRGRDYRFDHGHDFDHRADFHGDRGNFHGGEHGHH